MQVSSPTKTFCFIRRGELRSPAKCPATIWCLRAGLGTRKGNAPAQKNGGEKEKGKFCFNYSVRKATTGSFLAAEREGIIPANNVSNTLMTTKTAAT